MQNKLSFRLSKKKEFEGILWTFSHLSFLRKWSSQIVLPQFSKPLMRALRTSPWKIDSDRKTRKRLLGELNTLYNPKQCRDILAVVERGWRKIEKRFFKAVSREPNLCLRKTYVCYLTFYGGEGSFGQKNQIYVRMNPDIPSDLRLANYTIMHELIHLMLETDDKACDTSQPARERFVESIIEKPSIRRLLDG